VVVVFIGLFVFKTTIGFGKLPGSKKLLLFRTGPCARMMRRCCRRRRAAPQLAQKATSGRFREIEKRTGRSRCRPRLYRSKALPQKRASAIADAIARCQGWVRANQPKQENKSLASTAEPGKLQACATRISQPKNRRTVKGRQKRCCNKANKTWRSKKIREPNRAGPIALQEEKLPKMKSSPAEMLPQPFRRRPSGPV